jgi:hypothetical protein
MATRTHFLSRSERTSRSLLARGGLARTFGSLASFLAFTFLGAGVYLLVDAFADPLAAQSGALVAAAFIIALASIILFYLFKPKPSLRTPKIKHQDRRHSASRFHRNGLVPHKFSNADALAGPNYGRRSTDHFRANP